MQKQARTEAERGAGARTALEPQLELGGAIGSAPPKRVHESGATPLLIGRCSTNLGALSQSHGAASFGVREAHPKPRWHPFDANNSAAYVFPAAADRFLESSRRTYIDTLLAGPPRAAFDVSAALRAGLSWNAYGVAFPAAWDYASAGSGAVVRNRRRRPRREEDARGLDVVAIEAAACFETRRKDRLQDVAGTRLNVFEGGVADGSGQDAFCGVADCVVKRIFDHSPRGNDLDIAPGGGHVKRLTIRRTRRVTRSRSTPPRARARRRRAPSTAQAIEDRERPRRAPRARSARY